MDGGSGIDLGISSREDSPPKPIRYTVYQVIATRTTCDNAGLATGDDDRRRRFIGDHPYLLACDRPGKTGGMNHSRLAAIRGPGYGKKGCRALNPLPVFRMPPSERTICESAGRSILRALPGCKATALTGGRGQVRIGGSQRCLARRLPANSSEPTDVRETPLHCPSAHRSNHQ